MSAPSEKEIRDKANIVRKAHECYTFLYSIADNDVLRKKIEELMREHLLSMTDEMYYSVKLPVDNRKKELEDALNGKKLP